MANKYLNDTGLQYFYNRLRNVFQLQENGKGLSSNDYTTSEKDKLAGIAAGAEVNVQSDWNVTDISSDAYIKNKPTIPEGAVVDTELSTSSNNAVRNSVITTAINGKANNASPALTGTPTAPTANAGTNTNQIATTAFVTSAISTAIGSISGIDFQIVQSLPATGTAGVIYLVPHQHDTDDIYDEYVWVSNAFEKIGSTDIDLSGYLKTTDMVSITTSEIDTLFA